MENMGEHMRSGRVTAIILTLLIFSGCAEKTHEDTVGKQDEIVHENVQEHTLETVEKHETVIEENKEALEKKSRGSKMRI